MAHILAAAGSVIFFSWVVVHAVLCASMILAWGLGRARDAWHLPSERSFSQWQVAKNAGVVHSFCFFACVHVLTYDMSKSELYMAAFAIPFLIGGFALMPAIGSFDRKPRRDPREEAVGRIADEMFAAGVWTVILFLFWGIFSEFNGSLVRLAWCVPLAITFVICVELAFGTLVVLAYKDQRAPSSTPQS